MDPKARTKARECAVQAIYQWQLTAHSFDMLYHQFIADNQKSLSVFDTDYFANCLQGVMTHQVEIDKTISAYSTRSVAALDGVERAILRLGVYELHFIKDTPFKVVINEALELTKRFGSIEGFKFVNGVLDKIAKDIKSKANGIK